MTENTSTYSPEVIDAIEALCDFASAQYVVEFRDRCADVAAAAYKTVLEGSKNPATPEFAAETSRVLINCDRRWQDAIEALNEAKTGLVHAREAALAALAPLAPLDVAAAKKAATMSGWTSVREAARRETERTLGFFH